MNTSFPSEEGFSLILNLLEKAEQILSVLNLSESAVGKYNQLKQLTFQKLNLNFTPLVKRAQPPKSQPDALVQNLFLLNIKKTMLIEVMLDYYSKQNQNIDFYIGQLDQIFNINHSAVCGKSIDDIDYEARVAEGNLKDIFCKFDEIIRTKSNLVTQVATEYEEKIKNIKNDYEKEIFQLKEVITKNSNIESDLFTVRKQNDMNTYLIDRLSQMISECYDKYYQKNISWYGSENYEKDKCPEIEKLNFLTNLVDKYYTDNKYLNDLVPSLQKEKLELTNERSLPFVNNVISKNDLMQSLCGDLNEMEKSSEMFHRNFEELINYIKTNVEGKVK